MGCDIHFYVERRELGKWVTCDTWEDDDGDLHVPYQKSFYHDRNYDLFAILADVRNGRGFAGVKTGEGFVPIADQRGIPDDACAQYKTAAESYGADGHSHSWLTVEELLQFDWTQVSRKQGIVGLVELAHWKVAGSPRAWSGGIWGHAVTTFDGERGVSAVETCIEKLRPEHSRVSWYTLLHAPANSFGELNEKQLEPTQQALIAGIRDELASNEPHFNVAWDVAYFDAAGTFLQKTMPRLWRLGKSDAVRVCFFFDN